LTCVAVYKKCIIINGLCDDEPRYLGSRPVHERGSSPDDLYTRFFFHRFRSLNSGRGREGMIYEKENKQMDAHKRNTPYLLSRTTTIYGAHAHTPPRFRHIYAYIPTTVVTYTRYNNICLYLADVNLYAIYAYAMCNLYILCRSSSSISSLPRVGCLLCI